MSNGIILRLIPLLASQITVTAAASVNAAFPAANIVDVQPKVVVQSNPSGAGSYDLVFLIDLLADTAIDTAALMFTNASAAATWDVRGSTSATGPSLGTMTTLLASTGFGMTPTTRENRRHGLMALAAPFTCRYLRIAITDTTANPETLIRAGIIAVGQRITPGSNFEIGSGRKVEDQSITRTLPGGETAIERGGRTPLWRGTWSNLTEAEYRSLWSLLMEVGTGAPVLIVEDPDAVTGQPEAMHYGLLTSLDFTERQQIDKQRIDVTIREMI